LVIGLLPDVERVLAQRALPSRPERVQGSGTAWVWTAYQANGKVLAVVAAKDTEALRALLRPLPHYGRQSFLVFDGARVVERGVWPAPGREWRLTAPD
jgi:aminopeptidase N